MRHYHSFLLRIWQNTDDDGDQWAAKLIGLQTGEMVRLASPDDLLSYLHARVADTTAPQGGREATAKPDEATTQ